MKRFLLLLAILVLSGALAASATAAPFSQPASPSAGAVPHHPAEAEDDEGEGDELEFEEDELELEDCEAEDFGFEFDEEGEEEELTEAEEEELEEECDDGAKGKDGKDSPFVTAPAACRISRAESKITALPAGDQVRLTVRYRTWAPTPVTVSLKLRDHKGAVGIEQATAHLGRSGVLHLTTKLGGAVMDRALQASEFDVTLLAPNTPGYCAGALEQRLHSVKHTGADAPRVYSNAR